MLHIILPDFRDYKSLKIGPKDKVKFIAPEDGNSTFSAEALILSSRTKAEIVNIADSSPIQMAFVIGRIAGIEKGDITVHSMDEEMSALTAPKKTAGRAPKKTADRASKKTPAAPKKHAVMDEYETDDEGMNILGEAFGITDPEAAKKTPAKREQTKRPASPLPATARSKAVKPNASVISRLLKSQRLDQSYNQLICDQFTKEGVSEATIDVFVRAAVSQVTKDETVIKTLGELIKKHWNEIIR